MLLLPLPAAAVLTIEITQGADNALPIAVVPFHSSEKSLPQDVAAIIGADLHRSGRFAPLALEKLPQRPAEAKAIDFSVWRGREVDHLVIGNIVKQGKSYGVSFQLFDTVKKEQMAGYRFDVTEQQLRRVSHRIADIIYEKITGVRGAFDTRLAYITSDIKGKKRSYSLAVADSDGHNEQIVLGSPAPLMSPSWSPDAKKLAYVSFEKGRSQIVIQDVATAKREVVASHKGINGAPVWSPDGKQLALTLSKDGNAEIYRLDLASKGLQRITRHYAIDTEPDWAPDGRSLIFTSDRGGRPQLYLVELGANGAVSRPKRLTFEGSYNSRGRYSPDGERLCLVHQSQGRFQIATYLLKGRYLDIISATRLGESPSFSPNGEMVIYASEVNNQGVLEVVSVDGRARQRLGLSSGDVREPAWSPFLQ